MCVCLGKFVVRYILVSINLLFFLIGAGLAIVGGIALYHLSSSPQIEVYTLKFAVILAIVLGCVIAIVSSLGWCGACAERKNLLYIYSAIILILAGLQIYGLVTLRNQEQEELKDMIVDSLEMAFNDTDLQSFHAMEASLKCCGTTGPDSYAGVYDRLPASCCKNATILPDFDTPIVVDRDMALSCYADDTHPGCNEVLLEALGVLAHYVGMAFIVVIAVEFLAMVMAMSLSCCIRSPKTV
ncbi:23 kDa integral membrane protein-like isoform X1 [Colias croceus]|uniref:23 kDa integral membrane protein-like isoform X1 n=1 Tax=Colias crocea TaxID=72248 RepID=UPI001E27DB24|nr:23 kDa integral membrane protein-like isoform X1 [Colias croceus]